MSKLYGELSKICLRTTLLVYLLTKRSVVLLCRQSKMCSANHCSGEFNEEPKYSIGIHWFCCTNASVPNTVFKAVRQALHTTVCEKVCGQSAVRIDPCGWVTKTLSLGSKGAEFEPFVRPSVVKIANHCYSYIDPSIGVSHGKQDPRW